MNLKRLALLPLILLGLAIAGPAQAQSEPPVEAMVTVPPGEYRVGDPIQLVLSVTHPADYHVIPPELEAAWGDFIVKSQAQPTTIANPDGTETTTQLIDVRLFAPGDFATPLLTVSVASSSGGLQEVTAPPAAVRITPVLAEGDEQLRDIKPQADLPYRNLAPYLLAGLLAMLALGGFTLWRRRRQARAALAALDLRLPHEVALDELDRIQALGLPESGRFKEHYTLVSNCLRTYMDRTLPMPVLERTTEEIQTSLKSADLAPEIGRQFVDFLIECDLVKFSKYEPDVPSAYHVLGAARQIVETTRPVAEVESQDSSPDGMHRPPEQQISPNGSEPKTEVTA